MKKGEEAKGTSASKERGSRWIIFIAAMTSHRELRHCERSLNNEELKRGVKKKGAIPKKEGRSPRIRKEVKRDNP